MNTDSKTMDMGQDLRPMVAGTGKDWSAWIFGGLLGLLAIVLFITLNARREERSAPAVLASDLADIQGSGSAVPEFPFPEIDARRGADEEAELKDALAALQDEPPPYAEPAPVPLQFAPQPVQQTTVLEPRRSVPAMAVQPVQPDGQLASQPAPAPPARPPHRVLVYDKGIAAPAAGSNAGATVAGESASSGSVKGPKRNTAPASASRHIDPTLTVTRGTIIPAVLETALNTNHAGQARAIVSRDIRGFDGKRVLIPRGSRLLGEYEAEVSGGQSRILVVWDRLQRPDGAVVMLNSPSADSLGRAGIKGKARPNFFERFAGALLNTTLDIGGMVAAGQIGGNGAVILNVPNGIRDGNASQKATAQRTISVKQGVTISVFVARDLDFAPVEGGGR
jgi:type IV secretion system protein VirB10